MTQEQLGRGSTLTNQIDELKQTIHNMKLYMEAADDSSIIMTLKIGIYFIPRQYLTLDTVDRMINNLEHALSALQKQFDEL